MIFSLQFTPPFLSPLFSPFPPLSKTPFPFPPKPYSFPLKPVSFPLVQCNLNSPHNQNNNHSLSSDIDMIQTKQGVFAPKQTKVVVLWDLDNKPPRGPPYEAATALKVLASRFGEVVDISAYANRHAFRHLPSWVLQERREKRQTDVLERKGIISPSQPYTCSVCGRKCKTNFDLKKHFKQLHERERQKKLSRMKQLKGKKRQRFKERYLEKNSKVEEAARSLITPKVGYGLGRELRRAGVFVKTVEDKPQAADWALKRQMMHSMSRGVDWMLLVSDDSDFREMLRKAGEANLGTVVVGDRNGALGKCADIWVPWIGVENGEVSEKDLVPKRKEVIDWGDEVKVGEWNDELILISEFDQGIDSGNRGVSGRYSAFSEGEEEDEDWSDDDDEEWEEEDYDFVE